MNVKLIEKLLEFLVIGETRLSPINDNLVFGKIETYNPHDAGPFNVGDKVLVRGDRSGVFVGNFAAKNGTEVTLENVRWIWYWSGAASLFQLADEGVKNPSDCKFPKVITQVVILDTIQMLPVSELAYNSIMGVKVWEK